MTWTVWICDTVTGAKQQHIPVSAFGWGRTLNASAGSKTATIQLADSVTSELDVRSLTQPVRNTLVLDRDGSVVYAGLIWKRTYAHSSGALTLDHADLWSLFPRRLAADVVAPFIKVTKQTYTNISLSTLAKRVMALAMTGLPDDNRSLPITLPADVAGTLKRTYYGYHLNMLADVLEDIINEGLDIDLRPRWVNNKLDWEMRTGSLTSGLYEWNLTAEKHGVSGLTLTEDANLLSTTGYAVGEGMEEDMLMRSNRTLNPPYPAMDHIESYKTEDDEDRLSARSAADLTAFNHPTEQWGFSMLADGTPKLTDLLLGGTAKVYSKGDLWIPDGWNGNRLIGFSGDLSESVQLEFQPIGGA